MTVNSFAQFVTVLIIFVIVLALTFFVTRFIANYQKVVGNSGSNIEVIETYRISPSKYVQIIRVGKKYVSIVVCKDSVTTLTELSEDELEKPVEDEKSSASFKEIMDNLKNEFKPK